MKKADKAARAAAAPGAHEAVEARASGLYGSPTFEQVERLIAAVKANGQSGGEKAGGAKTVYCTCSTVSSQAAKVASTEGGFTFTAEDLKAGAVAYVKFTSVGNKANATLDVNETGAKRIMVYGTSNTLGDYPYSWQVGEVVGFLYDGTYWMMLKPGPATAGRVGVTVLSNTIDDTTTKAATPSAVKNAISSFVDGGAYVSDYGRDDEHGVAGTPTILLKHGEEVVAAIPADDFVVDGMLDDVVVASFAEDDERPAGVSPGDYLKFTFNAAASASGQKDIYVPLSSLCRVQVGYALDSTGQAVSAESPACSLRDRTSNRIVVGENQTIETLSLTLPQGGTVARDFYVRFEVGEGASIGALSFVLPGGGDAVIEPADVPVPAAGGATVVKFFESAPGVFAVTTVVAPSVEPEPEEPTFQPADPDDPELAGTVSTEGEVNDDGTLTVEGEVNDDGTLTVETEAP